MKGKFSTKTILISILTVILLAVAITGTVLFLKDSGKASAAQEDKKAQESQEVTLPVTGTDKQNEENTLPTTEENNTETNQEANQGRINEEVQNNNTQTNSNVQTERRTSENDSTNRVQGEQEFFTYRDKLVSEDFLVGWTPITVKALIQTSENELNVPELKINKKSYTEADIIYKDEGIVFPEETRYTYTRPEEKIFYEINVANISKIDAKNIRVYDAIPEGTTLFQKPENAEFENGKLTWTINIPAETEVSLRFIVTVNKEKTSGTIRNFAIVNGDKTNETENPVITYKKSVKQTEPLHEEEIIDYTISITNTGEVDTIVKQVEDTIPEGITYRQNSASHNGNYNEEDRKITWYDIPLLKNETVEITFKATVDKLPEGIYSKTIKNIAIVDGDNTNEVINEVVKPHITRLKENNPVEAENLHEGDTITYKITAGNDGTEAKTIKIEDEAPEGTTLKEIITAGGSKVGEKGVVWENVTLNPGDSRTFEFSVTVNNLPEKEYGNTIKNTAKVDEEDTNEVTNKVVKPHITRLKENNPVETNNLHEGDTITYKITAGNDGTEAKTIKIEDEAPEGTTLKEIITAGGSKIGEKGVVWENITLNPGDSKTFEFSVTVNNLLEKEYGKTIKNTAKVDGKDTNEVTNHVVKPHITAEKVSNPKTGSTVKYGEIITYTIKVKNDGTETKTVDITDNIPLNTEFDSVQDEGTTITNNGKVTGVKWTKTIPANTTTPITVSFKVKVTGNVAQKIENKAIVDNEETNKTEHEIVKQIAVEASNNPGKNIVIILDLSSSMIKVPTEGLDKSEYRYENEYGNTALKYVYAKDRAGSIEGSNSNLAKAKIALKRFAEEVLKNSSSDNKITLISFNYQSYDQAKTAIQKEPNWYHDRFEDLKAHNEIHPYVGVRTIVETKNYNEFVNKVDNIRIRAEYLLTNMVAGIKAAESKVADLKAEGKDIDVIFFGDGKPSLPTEYGAKVGFYDKDTTYSKIKESGENIRKNGAKLYTLEFLVTEKPEYTAIAKEAFKNMTGGVKTQDNKTRFSANTENVTNKLIELARTVDSNKNDNIATDKNGFATIKIPTGKELRISEKTKVQLYVSGSLVGEYDTIDKINNSGKLTYNNAEKCFRIDAKKYEAGSSIELKYYFK